MKFLANWVNNSYPRNIIEALKNSDTLNNIGEAKIAVAYADRIPELFDFCLKNNIPLSFYCRYDNSVPVSPETLSWFIGKQAKRIICRLARDFFHAKVMWIVGFGVYIGSANLSDRAWFDNIEAGLFLSEEEIDSLRLRDDLEFFFEYLEENSDVLTQEIIVQLKEREKKFWRIRQMLAELKEEESKTRIVQFHNTKISCNKQPAAQKEKAKFIEEWNGTLEIIREIAENVSSLYRPVWVTENVPKSTQADQFLHAYYFRYVIEKNTSMHRAIHEHNASDPQRALIEMMSWWKSTNTAPSNEDTQFYDWGPAILKIVQPDRILSLDETEFVELCCKIHAFRSHSRQIPYNVLKMHSDNVAVDDEDKIRRGALWVFNQRSPYGRSVLELINFLLFTGKNHDLPLRLWDSHRSAEWHIPHFGLSCLGELVGWALPENFPPRNGRTSKALYALGYNVKLYSE